jgi:hypothetical protein
MIASILFALKNIPETTHQLETVNEQALMIAAILGTGAVALSRGQLRKAKRRLLWIAVKNLFSRRKKTGDNKGALKVSLIILGILLSAMMIHFLSWIGIILVLLVLIQLLFIGKRRRRKY